MANQTRVVVNITTHETSTYVFDGIVTDEEAMEMINEGTYDPDFNDIHSQDCDIVVCEPFEQ